MAEPQNPGDLNAAFGPNDWLVDELYESYLKDRNSVDRAWWEFFSTYRPADNGGTPSSNGAPPAPAPAKAPTASAPASAPAPAKAPTASAPAPAAAPPAAPATSAPPAPAPAPAAPTSRAADAAKHAAPKTAPKPREALNSPAAESTQGPEIIPLRGAPARVVANMESSLEVPTATSVRSVPAKLLIDNRVVINNHLARSRGGKVSFTHLIGFALVRALAKMPELNYSFTEVNGKPAVSMPAHVNLGIAIDLAKSDGTRHQGRQTMDFGRFWAAYEGIIRKARSNSLSVEDFQGMTISLTNPGTIGTIHSVPRLMKGQGAIIGVGALEYPAEWQGASTTIINKNGVSKILFF